MIAPNELRYMSAKSPPTMKPTKYPELSRRVETTVETPGEVDYTVMFVGKGILYALIRTEKILIFQQ